MFVQAPLLLRNACVVDLDSGRGRTSTLDLSHSGSAAQGGKEPGTLTLRSIDLRGRIVLPGLIEAHTHLDKSFTLDRAGDGTGTLSCAIAQMTELKQSMTRTDVLERAERCLKRFLRNGATVVRTHIDVDPAIGLRAAEALVELRERYRGRVELQLVALARSRAGGVGEAEYRTHLEAAAELGIDVIGGSPTRANDPAAHLRIAFDVASKHGLPIDLHVDESDDPGDLALEALAEMTIAEGFEGRVVAGHCCSLAAADDRTAHRVIDKVAKASISIVTLPLCNLYLQGRGDRQPVRRGITRVKALLSAGVNVCAASDNVRDPFGPYGRADTLEAAWLTGLTAHFGPAEQTTLIDMVTRRAARAVGTAGEEDAALDWVVLDCTDVGAVLADRPPRLLVIKQGRIVHASERARQLGWLPAEV